MANRHLSRSIALQALFEWDFNGCVAKQLEPITERVAKEFAPGLESVEFVGALTAAVASKKLQLDNIIGKAAPEWPLEQIAIVDRNVLRIGLYELLFADKKEVPARVAINEAIELAKTFGGEKSGRFVNGVLGAVYKEIGEPGKDEVPAKKRRIKNIPYEEMPIEKLVGAVVYGVDDGAVCLALVHDIFGYWTLSKGHVGEGEDLKVATAREIKEEMGVAIDVDEALGLNEYIASDPDKGKLRKQVNYFLAKTAGKPDLRLEKEKGGLDRVEWFALSDIPDLKMYDDVVPIITKAVNILNARLTAGTV